MNVPKSKPHETIDPVCGMKVLPGPALGPVNVHGVDYYFCSASCKAKFEAAPDTYLHPQKVDVPKAENGAVETEYTCPMHPEVRQIGPGNCPICGMALEPVHPGPDAENAEFQTMRRRFWISLALTLPLFLFSMSELLPIAALEHFRMSPFAAWLQLALATPVVLWGGLPFFTRAIESIRNRHLNMFTLIGLGIGAAYLYSLIAVLFPSIFPVTVRGMSGGVDLYFEAAAVITTLVLLGQVLELKARSQTSSAIRALLNLTPPRAKRLLADGAEEDIPLDQIEVNDRLRVRPGEKVPTDGVILEGSSDIDESMITGESMPMSKTVGDSVIAGTVNGSGGFTFQAKHAASDTILSRIVQMVSAAQRSRAPIQRLADTVAGYFVPAVIAVSAVTFVIWYFFGPEPVLSHAFVNAVAVLIIACPCALGLATPMSIMVGTGRGAQSGTLIRDAEALETLEKVDTLVVDKTGTLTEGKPKLVSVKVLGKLTEQQVLKLAASLERASEHPIAKAIVNGVSEKGIALSDVSNFQSVTGKGVKGTIESSVVKVGNKSFIEEDSPLGEPVASQAEALRANGETVMFVSVNAELAGLLGVADPVKATTSEALDALRKDNLRIVMLTGDSQTTANAIGKRVGITDIRADVLPEDKYRIVKELQEQGRIVAMAGDGVNDAPALAQAQVGIAMGTGTDVAMESAGVTLVKGDLRGIVTAVRLSRATMRNIRENLFFAFVYNVLGVPVAAGVLYPAFGLLLSPMIAAAAMSLSSVSVIGNALRLRNVKLV